MSHFIILDEVDDRTIAQSIDLHPGLSVASEMIILVQFIQSALLTHRVTSKTGCFPTICTSGGVAEWLRRSVANLVMSSVLGSSPTVGTSLPQANYQLSCPSFRGR